MLVFGSVSTEIGHVVRMCFCAIKINEIEAKMTDAQRQVPGRRSKELRCQVVSRTPWLFASGDVLFPNPWGSSRTFVSKVGLIARVPLSGPVIPNLRFGGWDGVGARRVQSSRTCGGTTGALGIKFGAMVVPAVGTPVLSLLRS